MQETMQAMVLTGHGDMDAYAWHEDWPVPQAQAGEIRIKVKACGLNNTDVNTRAGWYSKTVTEATSGDGYAEVGGEDPSWGGRPLAFPRIQGADVCGIVDAVGPGVSDDLIGRRVITDCWLRDPNDPMKASAAGYVGSERDGGFAEYCVLPDRNVHVIESGYSDAELATFACSSSTAEGMLSRAGVGSGDRVLVTGASGGVGSALIQLAKRRGAVVIALASPAKHDAIREIGADHVLPRVPEDLAGALRDATGTADVSVVADIVGGPYYATLLDSLAHYGRYVCSGAIAGPMVELDLRTLYLRDLSFFGSTILPLHVFPDLVGYIEREEIKPLLAATYPLKELKTAQSAFIDKQHVGNIVVTP